MRRADAATDAMRPGIAGAPGFAQAGRPVRKAYRTGTHRAVPPEETLARARRLFPVLGITRIANVTGLDRVGVPVVMVCRPNGRSLAIYQGKGIDLAAAKASGAMESIERYHAEHMIAPLKLNTYEELRYTHNLVAAETLPRIENGQFHPGRPLLWIEGRDLLRAEDVWLPYELVHLNEGLPAPLARGCFRATSTGLAAGNDPSEALVHALCEAVERDAATLWQLRSEAAQERTRVDPSSVDDPTCRPLLDRIDAAGLVAAVWDIASDIGVPAFLCQVMERAAGTGLRYEFADGTGCHPARDVALLRAVTEALQARLTLIAGSRDDLERRYYADSAPDVLARQRRIVTRGATPRSFRAVPSWDTDTFAEDLDWLLDRLRGAGLDRAVAFDLTRPEFGLPVVRVVVPGLEDGEDLPGYLPGPRACAVLEAAQ